MFSPVTWPSVDISEFSYQFVNFGLFWYGGWLTFRYFVFPLVLYGAKRRKRDR